MYKNIPGINSPDDLISVKIGDKVYTDTAEAILGPRDGDPVERCLASVTAVHNAVQAVSNTEPF